MEEAVDFEEGVRRFLEWKKEHPEEWRAFCEEHWWLF